MSSFPIHNDGLLSDAEALEGNAQDLKAWIAERIDRSISVAGLTQTQAAERMGLKQPDLSAVLHGKLNGYSVERLARCLAALGDEVRFTVKGADGSENSFIVGGN